MGELTVQVDDLNAYTLTGLADDIAEGTLFVDPAQLELATELLLDVGDWAGDDEPRARRWPSRRPWAGWSRSSSSRTRPGWPRARRSTPRAPGSRSWSTPSPPGCTPTDSVENDLVVIEWAC